MNIEELLIIKYIEFNYNIKRSIERQCFGYNYTKYIKYWNLPHHRITIWLIIHLPIPFNWIINILYKQIILK
jgi:hypothetical protein